MEEINKFGIYFNMIKMRYQDYKNSLFENHVEVPTNKVNVFINLETALNYLSTVRDLENKLMIDKKYPDEIKTDIVNIAGHYKEFFIENGLDTKIFIYMTDLDSDLDDFKENKIIEDYRSYYMLKFTSNPKFIALGEKLRTEIIPDVKMICEYIPNVYFISSKNIDSGLIPYIIGEEYKDRTNMIISGDLHDTQYGYEKNYVCHYFKRSIKRGKIISANTKEYLKEIMKTDDVNPSLIKLYSNKTLYRILLSVLGDKYRSIPAINGLGVCGTAKILIDAIRNNKITPDMTNPMLLSSIFPDNYQADVFSNLSVIDLKSHYDMLLDGDKKMVLSQIVDQSDINTLHQLNRTIFSKNPLILETLLK